MKIDPILRFKTVRGFILKNELGAEMMPDMPTSAEKALRPSESKKSITARMHAALNDLQALNAEIEGPQHVTIKKACQTIFAALTSIEKPPAEKPKLVYPGQKPPIQPVTPPEPMPAHVDWNKIWEED